MASAYDTITRKHECRSMWQLLHKVCYCLKTVSPFPGRKHGLIKVEHYQDHLFSEVAERAGYALMSGHEYVLGNDEAEHKGDVLNRLQSESQKAHRIILMPGSASKK